MYSNIYMYIPNNPDIHLRLEPSAVSRLICTALDTCHLQIL